MPITLRTEEGEQIYQHFKNRQDPNHCPFCLKDLVRHEYQYWQIQENRFPYNKVAQKHDLLACKRHVKTIDELTNEEAIELESIIYQIVRRQLKYDQITFNVPHSQSIPFHFHLHLIELLAKE